jgi:hypothetical protein
MKRMTSFERTRFPPLARGRIAMTNTVAIHEDSRGQQDAAIRHGLNRGSGIYSSVVGPSSTVTARAIPAQRRRDC